jgi:hypothetical protein
MRISGPAGGPLPSIPRQLSERGGRLARDDHLDIMEGRLHAAIPERDGVIDDKSQTAGRLHLPAVPSRVEQAGPCAHAETCGPVRIQ